MVQLQLQLRKWCLDKSVYNTSKVLEEQLELFPIEDRNHITSIIEKILPDPSLYRLQGALYCALGDDVCRDIELVEPYKPSEAQMTIAACVHQTKLKGSMLLFKDLLSHPVSCVKTLQQRQNIVKRIGDIQGVTEPLFNKLEQNEKDILWFFEDRDAELHHLYDMVFFQNMLLKRLNHRGDVLTLYNTYRVLGSPLVGVLMPITYFVIPFLILRYKFGTNIGFLDYIKFSFMSLKAFGQLNTIRMISYAFSLIFYFQGLFNSIEVAKSIYHISKLLTEKIQGTVRFIHNTLVLADMWGQDDVLKDVGAFFHTSQWVIPETMKQWHELNSSASFSIFSNYGKYLACYKQFKREDIFPILMKAYVFDTLAGIHRSQAQYNLCYPEFVQGHAHLDLQGLYHPCLWAAHANPVKNNLLLAEPKSAILTGPNAGGKSTLLKSVLVASIMAQSLGVAPATYMRVVPFVYINSQINIPDCKGKESLFEAEMHRCKHTLDALQTCQGPSLVVMDEIFNSTNPVEGISGAYAIIKKLGSYPENISMVSTHFLYLTKLVKEYPHIFIPLKMNVVLNKDGGVDRTPYVLQRGVSKQYVALELLKANNFDMDIINEALAVKTRLTSK